MGIIKSTGQIIKAVGDVAEAMGTKAQSVAKLTEWAVDTAIETGEVVKEVIKNIWQWIKKTAEKIYNLAKRFLEITINTVTEWFKQRFVRINKQNDVMFVLTEELRNGEYNVVQGIFSKQLDDVIDFQSISAKKVDSTLFANKEQVVLVN